MFRRDIKKQFNENKYNVLTAKGVRQSSQLEKLPFQKHLIGTIALMVLGFNFTKRYMTFPHHHKDESQPMLMLNGELHPFEHQPKGAEDKYRPYTLHKFESVNYCNLDTECGDGSCCYEQKCVANSVCMVTIYIPLFVFAIFSFLFAFLFSIFVINKMLKNQEMKIKKDIAKRKLRETKKRQKEKQRLLDASKPKVEVKPPPPPPPPKKEKKKVVEQKKKLTTSSESEEEENVDDFINGVVKQKKAPYKNEEDRIKKVRRLQEKIKQQDMAIQTQLPQINQMILQGLLTGKVNPQNLQPDELGKYQKYIMLMQQYQKQKLEQAEKLKNLGIQVNISTPQQQQQQQQQQQAVAQQQQQQDQLNQAMSVISQHVSQMVPTPQVLPPSTQVQTRPPSSGQQVPIVAQMNFQATAPPQQLEALTPENSKNVPKFFGKPNNDGIGAIAHPIYGNLLTSENTPNAIVEEQKNNGVDLEAKEKRNLLLGLQGPLKSHLNKRKGNEL